MACICDQADTGFQAGRERSVGIGDRGAKVDGRLGDWLDLGIHEIDQAAVWESHLVPHSDQDGNLGAHAGLQLAAALRSIEKPGDVLTNIEIHDTWDRARRSWPG